MLKQASAHSGLLTANIDMQDQKGDTTSLTRPDVQGGRPEQMLYSQKRLFSESELQYQTTMSLQQSAPAATNNSKPLSSAFTCTGRMPAGCGTDLSFDELLAHRNSSATDCSCKLFAPNSCSTCVGMQHMQVYTLANSVYSFNSTRALVSLSKHRLCMFMQV